MFAKMLVGRVSGAGMALYKVCVQNQVRLSSSSSKRMMQAQGAVEPSKGTTENVAPLPATDEQPSQESRATEISSSKESYLESRRRAQKELEDTFTPFRYVYPEFLPDPNLKHRNRVAEKLERLDMLSRRAQIDIPEFYAGSILSVTSSDPNAPGKTNTFVGICTERQGTGLRATFTLRNVIDGMGVEIAYDLYNPTIQNITCLRLEKRLDDNLRYLRDAPPEYSTVPFDMAPEVRNPDAPVPINGIKVKLNPKPWSAKWHLWDLKGVEEMPALESWARRHYKVWEESTAHAYKDYDLMKTYRSTIPIEEQVEIYSEFGPQLTKISQSLKKQKRKRVFVKPTKTA